MNWLIIILIIIVVLLIVNRYKTGNFFEKCPKDSCTLDPRQITEALPLCQNVKEELDKNRCKINQKDGYNLNENVCCELYPNIKLEKINDKLVVTRIDCSGINQCYINSPVAGLQPCVPPTPTGPDFSYYNKVIKPQEPGMSYDQFVAICSASNQDVCLATDICKDGNPIDPKASVFDGDNWIAIGDTNNSWLTLNASRLCKTHQQVAGSDPSWGTTSDPQNFYRAVKCCPKRPPAPVKKTWQDLIQEINKRGVPFNLRSTSAGNIYLGVVYYKSGWNDYLLGDQVITEGDIPIFKIDNNGLKLTYQRYCGYNNIEESNRYITAYDKAYFAKDPASAPQSYSTIQRQSDGWIVICPDPADLNSKRAMSTQQGGCYYGNNPMNDAVYLGRDVAPSKYKIQIANEWYNILKPIIPNIDELL